MQKKSKIIIISVVTAILLVVGVFMAVTIVGADNSAQAVATEKLSLGQKFLLDLEYDKAVAEFQAVIDIEPKNVDAYIGLADAYIGMGEEEKAIETLEKGLSETGDETIRAKLDEMKKPEETTPEVTTTPKGPRIEREDFNDGSYRIYEYDSNGNEIKRSYYNPDGTLDYYLILEYDSNGNRIKENYYKPDGTLDYYYTGEYDSKGNCIKISQYNADGNLNNVYEYDSNGNKIKESCYYSDGNLNNVYEYDSNGNRIKESCYYSDGTLYGYWISEYDSNGNEIKTSYYNGDGTLNDYSIREYDSNGNWIKTSYYNPDGTPR